MDAIIDYMTVNPDKSAKSVSLTLLADNVAGKPFAAEHGFSVFVELRESTGVPLATLLFDTGMGVVFENAKLADVDLSLVTDVVLSHGHYDHTDVLEAFVGKYPLVGIHASAGIFDSHYSLSTGKARSISLSDGNRSMLANNANGTFQPFRGMKSIARGLIHLAETIPRDHPLEKPSPLLFTDELCSLPDTVAEELVLWFDTPMGLVILTGCCHAGFINTCEYVRRLSGDRHIHAVIGGFHLAGVGEGRLEATAAYILDNEIERVIPCHCTGTAESNWLIERLGARVVKGECGMVIRL